MILFLCLAALVGGVVWYRKASYFEDALPFALALVGGIGTVFSLVFWLTLNIGVEGTVVANQQEYEMLTYQLESNMYDNDNDIGKKELMNQIQEWNSDLAWCKANQKDFWIGVFIPNIFDQFEYINVGGNEK